VGLARVAAGAGAGAAAVVMRLPHGLSVMRILVPGERNIWRIGSLQSCISTPAAEVICVAVALGDGASSGPKPERPTKHHMLGIRWMLAPTTLSPSSFPLRSNNVSESEKKHKENQPLKIMQSFKAQTLPKTRNFPAVSRNTRPSWYELSVRTLILSCWKV
jgi:hypothetical protein